MSGKKNAKQAAKTTKTITKASAKPAGKAKGKAMVEPAVTPVAPAVEAVAATDVATPPAPTPDADTTPVSEEVTGKQEGAKAKGARRPKTPKAPKADKGMSCLDAAAEVLKANKDPMQCKAMVDAMGKAKLWSSDAPTPAATLYSAILREIQKKGSASRFRKTDRGHFALMQ